MNRQSYNEKLTAAYCRLSSDDKDKDESNSISTQKKIITAYAGQNGFKNLTFFIDDGISGSRFDRPGYVAMMEEVEAGNVDTVIIKDLSRAGRDHIRVGLFTETLDRNGVRFIAVSDNVDSTKGYDDLVPFKNIFNEWFVRDCSRKVSAAYRAKGNEGKHTGSHPLYGYIHSPDDKEQWIIDEPAAEIVRRIFRMTVEGKGAYQIANILQKEKVFCPSYYLAQQGVGNRKNKDFPDPYRWWGTTVTCLLSRMEYMGHTVNFKTYKTSYKDKNRKRAPQDKWAIFDNTHEAIIDSETWETAQRLMQTVRRTYENHGEPNRLTGLLYCADCNGKLYHERGMRGKGEATKNNYICSSYRKHTTDCTAHYIGVEVLEKLILDALKEISGYVKTNKDDFIKSVTEMSSAYQAGEEKAYRKRLAESEKRISELDRLICGIYEDKINGTLSEKRFAKLSDDYEREQDELERSITDLRSEIDRLDIQNTRADKFVNVVNRYTDFEELTTPMLNEFIEKIIVHERIKEYRYKNSQTIDIYFNFVGMVELSCSKMTVVNDKSHEKKYVADTTSFSPLAEYLTEEEHGTPTLTLSFSDVENILGKELCASARKFKSYWYPALNRPISNVIYNSGYDVGTVDLKNQTITLTKPEIIREEGA